MREGNPGKEAVAPCSKPDGSSCEWLREKMMTTNEKKKAYERVFLVLTPVLILCLCTLPIILYFTVQVSVLSNVCLSDQLTLYICIVYVGCVLWNSQCVIHCSFIQLLVVLRMHS